MGATLTPFDRADLRQRLDGLERDRQRIETRAKPFRDRLKPFEEKLAQLDERAAIALEEYGLDQMERCHCGALLIEGDLGCHTEEGEYLCEACAPTWAELAKSIEEGLSVCGRDPDEDEACTLALARERVLAGRGGEKAVSPVW